MIHDKCGEGDDVRVINKKGRGGVFQPLILIKLQTSVVYLIYAGFFFSRDIACLNAFLFTCINNCCKLKFNRSVFKTQFCSLFKFLWPCFNGFYTEII